MANKSSLPASGKAGGQMSHSYTYDALYRLSSATGTYTDADSKTASYTLSMGYDNMHRITSKSQHLTQDNLQFDGTLNVGYDLTYTYGQEEGKKFQLDNVTDVNYRTETAPGEDGKVTNSHAYEYDANGNLVYVNTGRTKKDGTTDEKARERKLKWDEENRLLASDDDGFVTNYWYDADGERTVKTSGESEQVYVNSGFAGGRTNTAKFSLYVSPYLVANQGGRYTKHIYIGGERIVSKIGDFASYGPDPRRIEYAGSEADAVTVDYDVKYSQQLQAIKNNYATFGVPYNGTDNDDYVNGEGFCCDDGSLEAAQAEAVAQANALDGNFQEGDAYERLQFYYHADHLGSTSYITNLDGEVVQHVEYVPFGEVFIEERNNTWNTPYLFNAKEFDEETGLYYYGARYYDPRLSVWISTDPLEEKYISISSYCFTNNNPLKYIDPNGTDWYKTNKGWLIWNPKVHSQKDLQKGYTYVGKTYFDKNTKTSYRKDGTILFSNEKLAYQRMWYMADKHWRSKKYPAGKEESAFLLQGNKILVMADNWNDSETSEMVGYKRKDGVLYSSLGKKFVYLGQVHTHQSGGDKGLSQNAMFYDDDDFAAEDPNHPIFVLHKDGNIYGGYYSSKRAGFDSFGNEPIGTTEKLFKGEISLFRAVKEILKIDKK